MALHTASVYSAFIQLIQLFYQMGKEKFETPRLQESPSRTLELRNIQNTLCSIILNAVKPSTCSYNKDIVISLLNHTRFGLIFLTSIVRSILHVIIVEANAEKRRQ